MTSTFSIFTVLPKLLYLLSKRYKRSLDTIHYLTKFSGNKPDFSFNWTQFRFYSMAIMAKKRKSTEENILQLLDESKDECKDWDSSTWDTNEDDEKDHSK